MANKDHHGFEWWAARSKHNCIGVGIGDTRKFAKRLTTKLVVGHDCGVWQMKAPSETLLGWCEARDEGQ